MQTKTTIRFFTIADYEKEQEYIFALLFGILICLYLLVFISYARQYFKLKNKK